MTSNICVNDKASINNLHINSMMTSTLSFSGQEKLHNPGSLAPTGLPTSWLTGELNHLK